MGRVLVLVAAAVALVALAACAAVTDGSSSLIDRVGGGRVVVVNMTPVGESPHDLALTARQRDEVQRADLAVVIGRGFQPELEDAAAGGGGEVVSLLDTLDLPDQPAGGHVWLDPTLMGTIATTIGEALAALDPDAADDHRERAQELVEQLVALDARIGAGLADCERDALVTQHDAFGWFAARYGLRTFALDAAQPDDDPAPEPAMVAAVEPLVRDGSVVTLFTETLLPPSWVEVLAEERGLETDVLNPYEGLTATESARDVDYERVQLSNLQTLREHLDCAAS